jgi:hypothetical protein
MLARAPPHRKAQSAAGSGIERKRAQFATIPQACAGNDTDRIALLMPRMRRAI